MTDKTIMQLVVDEMMKDRRIFSGLYYRFDIEVWIWCKWIMVGNTTIYDLVTEFIAS